MIRLNEKRFDPQSHLEKHGWQKGSGLGRGENGIKEAIKVKIKNDTTGVGHDPGKEFSFHWWDHVFNKAANSFQVHNTEEGVRVTQVPAKSKKAKKKATKKPAVWEFYKGFYFDL
ncbi:G patch domain-containing protein 4 [Lamellibrachia satsuma]|nr:G patch domain-containing protein 4 [Lamellibrachia satsuma]